MRAIPIIATLILLGGMDLRAQDMTVDRCGSACEAILMAAAVWGTETAADVQESDTTSTYLWIELDSGSVEELEAQRDSLSRSIGNRLGLPVDRRTQHPGWKACQEGRIADSRVPACRAAAGVTFISIDEMQMKGNETASVQVSIIVIGSEHDFLRSSELHLERVDDEWVVSAVGLTIVS